MQGISSMIADAYADGDVKFTKQLFDTLNLHTQVDGGNSALQSMNSEMAKAIFEYHMVDELDGLDAKILLELAKQQIDEENESEIIQEKDNEIKFFGFIPKKREDLFKTSKKTIKKSNKTKENSKIQTSKFTENKLHKSIKQKLLEIQSNKPKSKAKNNKSNKNKK